MNVPLVDLLYELKRDWGQVVQLFSVTSSTVDPETGQVGTGTHICNIEQVILFPIEIARSTIKAFRAGDYSYDSNYDKGTHVSLIEKVDLPLGVVPTQADTLVTSDGQRYEVKEVNDLYEAWEIILVGLNRNDY